MQEDYSQVITLLISTTILIFLLAGIVISFFLYFKSRKIKHQIEINEIQSQFNQTLLQSQLEIQEQTLHNISQEIHDNIGQVLSLTKLNLSTMDINDPHQLQQKVDDSKKLIGKVIQDLRDLSKSLNTDYVSNMGLLQAIEYELDMIRKSGAYQAILLINGLPFKAEPQKELIIFRIVQEVINNIIKHAQATEILVTANYHPANLNLTITDNGAGFDLTPLNLSENGKFGLGLRNMHKRAQLIGATFSITSTIGAGTAVSITLPLQPGVTNTLSSQVHP